MAAATLLLAGALAAATAPAPLADPFPRAGAAYLIAVDGEPRWAHDPDLPRPPASLTKLLTALVVLESRWDPDAWVTVSARAARAHGARANLRRGEQLLARDALAAMLVSSANDACLALAEHSGGTVEAFVARLNRRAREMGLRRTSFENPCGYDAPGQRSTARELWLITRAALAHPAIKRMAALDHADLAIRSGRAITVRTTNMLLGRVEGVDGLKTGYTRGAGRCMVASARRGTTEVVLVLLGAAEGWPDRWWTSAALVEAAFREAPRG